MKVQNPPKYAGTVFHGILLILNHFYSLFWPLEYLSVRGFWLITQIKRKNLSIEGICYHILHVDLGIEERNKNVNRLDDILLSSNLKNLDAPTHYFKSPISAEAFIHDKFAIRTVHKVILDEEGKIKYKFPWVAGNVGYYASLLETLTCFLKSDFSTLIIFEDDYEIRGNFVPIFRLIMQKAPKDWELLKLNKSNLKTYNSFLKHISRSPFFPRLFSPWGCGCIVLNRKSALKILNDLKIFGIRAPVDLYLYNFDHHSKHQVNLSSFEINPFFPLYCECITSPDQSTLRMWHDDRT